MTDEEKKERFEIVRKTHDELKEHPYWLNFDKALLRDVLGLFSKISGNYWGITDKTNPYYAVISCVTHDFNCMLGSISDSIRLGRFEENWGEHMGDVIMVMQVYLMNIHRMIEGREPDGNVVGYTYTRIGDIEKYQAFPDPNKEGFFTVYKIVKEDRIPHIRIYLNKYAGLDNECSIKTWAINCLKELNEGNDVIGECWKIVK